MAETTDPQIDTRTNEELIQSLRRHRADSDINEAARRLRAQDEGERIEGFVHPDATGLTHDYLPADFRLTRTHPDDVPAVLTIWPTPTERKEPSDGQG